MGSSAVFLSGFSPLGVYACVYSARQAAIVRAFLEPDYDVVDQECRHLWCSRHTGWRIDTNAPYSVLKDFAESAREIAGATI